MKFTTASGTTFELDTETRRLTRHGVKPLKSVVHGGDMDEEPAGDIVLYDKAPTVGESFFYYHPRLFGCASTPVVSIEEDDVHLEE